MSTIRSEADTLSMADSDALLKHCRFSLRILDTPPQPPPEDVSLSVEDVLSNTTLREFLYQGEHVQAFVVAIISNTDQSRLSLATEMRRKDSLKLTRSELAVDASEIEQFFARLNICVTGHSAKTVIAPLDSSKVPHKSSGRIAPSRRISNVSCSAAFTTNIKSGPERQHHDIRIGKLDNGSWCCAYQFTINTPSTQGFQDPSIENAILLEVRAACEEPGASLNDKASSDGTKAVTYRGGLSDRSSHLEELSIRLSSWMSDNNSNSQNPGLFEQQTGQDRRNVSESASIPAPSRSYKMIQALVPTRPILTTSVRIVSLPPSFGTDAALVEVGVQSDPANSRPISLESVEFETSHWHIQQIGSQKSSLPFVLSTHSCYQMVFRASPLTDPVKAEATHGINLLNISNLHIDTSAKRTSLLSSTLNDGSSGKHVEMLLDIRLSARVERRNGEDSGNLFEVVYRVYPHCMQSKDRQSGYEHTLATGTASLAGRTSNASETLHSTSPRSICSQSKPSAVDSSRGYSHLKTASLDHKPLQIQQPPGRKYSLALPPKTYLAQADTRSAQILQGKHQPTGQLRVTLRPDRKHSNDQRLRSATVNAFGALPPLPSQKPSLLSPSKPALPDSRLFAPKPHNQQGYVSTIHSVSTSPSLDTDRVSLRRRQSVGSILATESLHSFVRARATVGTIELSFEAPPKVDLGKRLSVNAYISNNTNTHYFRLCLVDGNGAGAADDMMFEHDGIAGTQGLVPMNHVTTVPPLRPGESTFVALQYIAAAPYFHAVSTLRLVNLDADTADKTVTSIDSPFVVFIDDIGR